MVWLKKNYHSEWPTMSKEILQYFEFDVEITACHQILGSAMDFAPHRETSKTLIHLYVSSSRAKTTWKQYRECVVAT